MAALALSACEAPPTTEAVRPYHLAARVSSSGDRIGLRFTAEIRGTIVSEAVVTLSGPPGAHPRFNMESDGGGDRQTAAFSVAPQGGSLTVDTELSGVSGVIPGETRLHVVLAGTSAYSVGSALIEAPESLVVGAPCDPTGLWSLCPPDSVCAGLPPTCTGAVPALTHLGFFSRTHGPEILAAGTDPTGVLAAVRLEFLDATGASILVDLDNDGAPESGSFEVEATATDGAFLLRLVTAETFPDLVPRIRAAPIDVTGRAFAPLEAAYGPAPVSGVGDACDPRGFVGCAPEAVCLGATASTCTPVAPLREAACTEAPFLEAGGSATLCTIAKPLWTVPAGCAPGDTSALPEAVVRVRSTAGGSLTVRFDQDVTQIDPVLSVRAVCDGSEPLACMDDGPDGPWPEAVLDLLPGEERTLVIHAWGETGGCFTMRATQTD
ncbi:MAG: hypothetical protein AMXMBFR64_22040 [Myxococcales bacterium]